MKLLTLFTFLGLALFVQALDKQQVKYLHPVAYEGRAYFNFAAPDCSAVLFGNNLFKHNYCHECRNYHNLSPKFYAGKYDDCLKYWAFVKKLPLLTPNKIKQYYDRDTNYFKKLNNNSRSNPLISGDSRPVYV
jgi:hypothetical protein